MKNAKTPRKVDKIVRILLEQEENLSDGYEYYIGVGNTEDCEDEVKSKLRKMAEEILSEINGK